MSKLNGHSLLVTIPAKNKTESETTRKPSRYKRVLNKKIKPETCFVPTPKTGKKNGFNLTEPATDRKPNKKGLMIILSVFAYKIFILKLSHIFLCQLISTLISLVFFCQRYILSKNLLPLLHLKKKKKKESL